MRHPPQSTLAAYAAGAADVTTNLLVEAHLALCPTCSCPVLHGRDGASTAEEAMVADGLQLPSFDQVWADVEQIATRRMSPAGAVLPAGLVAALPDPAAWRWISLWPANARSALLVRDADTGSELYLSYYGPETAFPHHRHVGLEENVIVSGGYRDGDVHVDVADWVVGMPGTAHSPATGADEECWCLSRIEPPGVRFTGWRMWVQLALRR